MHIYSFHSINRISKRLVKLSIAYIFTSGILLILNCYVTSQDLSNKEESFFIQYRGPILILVLIDTLIGFILLIFTLHWFYRANKNIHAFGAKGISSPAMAVIWWFVPILQLWKPYKVARDIWKISDPKVDTSNSNAWKYSGHNLNIVRLWWILAILSGVLSVVSAIVYNSNPELPTQNSASISQMLFYSDLLTVFSNISSIISTIYFISMIKQISKWQEIKAGHSI